MDDKVGTPSDPRALATIVAGMRADLIDSAIDSLETPTRNMLIAELVVNDFFDHLLSALNVATFKGMESWLRGATDGYLWTSHGRLALLGSITAFKQMFWLRSVGYEHIAIALDAFEAAIVQVFPVDHPPDPNLCNEIDVAIDDLIARLSFDCKLTADHARAVGAWSHRIAKAMNLSNDETAYVRRAAMLCDIGKMTTPRDILLAQRGLVQSERRVMEQHAAAGARMINDVAELRPYVPIILTHHERFDGKGYPSGVAARGIPTAARIVAVADSFNAMIAPRPHRTPKLPMDALDELHQHRATQFDPDVVDAMTAVVRDRLSVAS